MLVHGFAASTRDPAVVRQAESLQAAGFEVCSYDARGHGDSAGLCTLGDLESRDVAAGVDWAVATGLPVVLVGASMGAIAALRYAAGPGVPVAGVVTLSCPASWRAPRSIAGVLLAGLTQTRLGRRIAKRHMNVALAPSWSSPEPPCELVARLAAPLAVLHGEGDRYIAAEDAVTIHQVCPSPRRLELVPGMGHAFDEKALPGVLAAVEWLLSDVPLLHGQADREPLLA